MRETLSVLIDLKASGLDLEPEEWDPYMLRLAHEMKEDLVEEAKLARQTETPEGSKSGSAGFDWGILKAEVNLENLSKLLGWLKERVAGSTLTLEYGDVRLEYRTEEDLQQQLSALERISDLKVRVTASKADEEA